jgi:hypothetical protein
MVITFITSNLRDSIPTFPCEAPHRGPVEKLPCLFHILSGLSRLKFKKAKIHKMLLY